MELERMRMDMTTSLGLGVEIGVHVMPRAQRPLVQLDLLPMMTRSSNHDSETSTDPAPSSVTDRFSLQQPFLSRMNSGNAGCNDGVLETHSSRIRGGSPRDIDMNQLPSTSDCDDEAVVSSPSSIGMNREREKLHVLFDPEQDMRSGCDPSSRRGSDDEDGSATTRKKLRLSKEQSALLEESFKDHSTLNPKQKNTLAKQLNLRPRQVEVWFQNRRARTKLKQTEVDCEVLKRYYENLTEDNRRLKKELQEVRALKQLAPVPPPPQTCNNLYNRPLPAATLTMCPSCHNAQSSLIRSFRF